MAIEMDVDTVMHNLLQGRKKQRYDAIPLDEVLNIKLPDAYVVSKVVMLIFRAEPLCLNIEEDVVIVGDIHGQYDDLLYIFKKQGLPPDTRYLFLGDYVDRGILSLETVMLVFLLKIKHPEHIFLLRGNHETKSISSIYGFRDDIKKRFGSDHLWRKYCEAFGEMPICAVVGRKVFACHGGLAPSFLTQKINPGLNAFMDYINDRERPYTVVQNTELFDVLWSDPYDSDKKARIRFKYDPPNRKCTVWFTEVAVKEFLEKYELKKIIRAHQAVVQGCKKYADGKLLTIFSAPGYCGNQRNKGAIVKVTRVKKTGGWLQRKMNMEVVSLPISEDHFQNKALWHTPHEIQSARKRTSVKALRTEAERFGRQRKDYQEDYRQK